MGKSFWMVRAGESSVLFDLFKQRYYVAVGWNELGDLTAATSLDGSANFIRLRIPVTLRRKWRPPPA